MWMRESFDESTWQQSLGRLEKTRRYPVNVKKDNVNQKEAKLLQMAMSVKDL